MESGSVPGIYLTGSPVAESSRSVRKRKQEEAKMTVEAERSPITEQLGPATQDNIVILKQGPDLMEELHGLAEGNHLFEAILVDSTLSGFLFPAEMLIEAASLADSLLELRGALVFLKTDSAVAIVKESLTAAPSFRCFTSYAELFDFSPSLTRYIKKALGQAAGFAEESTDLSQQILMSAIPVMTPKGLQEKISFDSPGKRNRVLALVDNYSPVAAIVHRCEGRMLEEEVLEVLRDLEKEESIYPIFAKVPFLANCFKTQGSFTIEEYFTGCRILPQTRLDELILELQGTNKRERMSIGHLAVKRELLNARQLEIALNDQAFYGQTDESSKSRVSSATTEEEKVQSLVGHLGSTDPSNLLQNIATNRETGVLSVEMRDMQFKAFFENGRPTFSRIGKLHGNNAVIEFASAWTNGIFVFIKRSAAAPDLTKDTCKVTKPLDKLLLDAALAKDNTDVVWKRLPAGPESSLERIAGKSTMLEGDPLVDKKENTKLTDAQMETVKRVWGALDGLTPIARVVKTMGDVTTSDAAYAIGVMLDYELVKLPDGDMTGPMTKFQMLVRYIREEIGAERNSAFLRLSLRDTLGFSGRARVFILSGKGEVGVDLAAARSSGSSLSTVVSDLENWQVKYIEYVSQELERSALLGIIRKVHEEC